MALDGFKYTKDGRLDTWRILTGPVKKGDCDDFAVTVLYEECGRSLPRFWFKLITFQAVLWYVTTPRGVGHLMLWMPGKNRGWIDNRLPKWRDDHKNRKWFPMLAPIVALKLFLGKLTSR